MLYSMHHCCNHGLLCPTCNRRGHRGMILSDVWCLMFVAYIGPKLRTERHRKTEIGTEVAHVTRDSDTSFTIKISKVKVTRPLYSPPSWHVRQMQRWAWERVGRGKLLLRCSLLDGARRFSGSAPTRNERGVAYRGGGPPTACLSLHYSSLPTVKMILLQWM